MAEPSATWPCCKKRRGYTVSDSAAVVVTGTPSSEGHSSAVDVDMVKTRGSPCEKDGLTSMQGAEGSEALGQNLFKIPDTRGVITGMNTSYNSAATQFVPSFDSTNTITTPYLVSPVISN